jgi:hypothetical protein
MAPLTCRWCPRQRQAPRRHLQMSLQPRRASRWVLWRQGSQDFTVVHAIATGGRLVMSVGRDDGHAQLPLWDPAHACHALP